MDAVVYLDDIKNLVHWRKKEIKGEELRWGNGRV